MLSQYAKEYGFENCEFFVDDGYSETNFNRPDFQRMITLIEQGKVGTVIVKDLSRLGRNYLETGNYTEVIFPEYKVRFIGYVGDKTGDDMKAPQIRRQRWGKKNELVYEKAVYACLNYGEAFCLGEIKDRSICIDGDIGEVLGQIDTKNM